MSKMRKSGFFSTEYDNIPDNPIIGKTYSSWRETNWGNIILLGAVILLSITVIYLLVS